MTAVPREPFQGARRPRPPGARVARGLACGVFTVVLVAGCGGGGGGGSSRADYVAKVSRLCRESASERRTLVPPANATPQQLVDAIKEAVAVDMQLQQRITTLSPPSADAGTIRRLVSLMTESDQVALQLADAIQRGDARTMNVLYPRLSQLGTQTKQIENRYGLQACSEKL